MSGAPTLEGTKDCPSCGRTPSPNMIDWCGEDPCPLRQKEAVLPCELIVGSGRFQKGVRVATAQGAIDRLYERMRLLECRLGELCYKCKLGIFQGQASHQINVAPDAASGGTMVSVHADCVDATNLMRTWLRP